MRRAMVSVAAGAARVAVSGGQSERAVLTLKGSDEPPLRCQFNPTEYSISKSSTWARVPVRAAVSASIPEFIGTNAATLRLELFFDAREHDRGGVAESVNRLLSWTQPSPRSIEQNAPTPPVVAFQWGQVEAFDAYLSSVAARYVLFRRDGTPIRAHVTLVLEEIPLVLRRQNPTSGSEGTIRQRTLLEGESLALVAYHEYGRPELWRLIADASGIDDPARVAPGTPLIIAPPPPPAPGRGRPAT